MTTFWKHLKETLKFRVSLSLCVCVCVCVFFSRLILWFSSFMGNGHSSINIPWHTMNKKYNHIHSLWLCGPSPTHLMQNWPHNSKYFLSAQEAESSRQPGAIKVFQYRTFTDTEASKRNTQCSYSFMKQLGAIDTHHRKRINIRRKNNILKTALNGTDCGNTGNLFV